MEDALSGDGRLTRHVVSEGIKVYVMRPAQKENYECDQKLLMSWKERQRETRRNKHASRGAEEGAKLRRTDLPNSERESLVESGK